ncbi:hypothetical protein FI667_g14816, partial [Globisporangium splendens]
MSMYHEKQELYRCGIHALNNVLQAKVFEKAAFDAASEHLASVGEAEAYGGNSSNALLKYVWNPHRAPLGLGNYDVNVLMYVLEQKGYKLQWIDKRRPVTKELLAFDTLEGVLCNVITSSSLWRRIDGVYYNLDSKLAAPVAFKSEEDCYAFLQELVDTGECELFAVASNDEAAAEPKQESAK